jgi:hypothetical protein
MQRTCVRTVLMLIPCLCAVPFYINPAAKPCKTSCSRVVSCSCGTGALGRNILQPVQTASQEIELFLINEAVGVCTIQSTLEGVYYRTIVVND